MTINKPEPVVEKIELTQDQKDEIQIILAGHPTKDTIEKMKNRIVDVDKWLKNRIPSTNDGRMRLVREKYTQGVCIICRDFPDYKVTYHLDGIALVEFYCKEHMI